MAKSSISADVKAANSKLAQFLRRQEEEEKILQIGKSKPKQEREEKRMPAGRARWSAQPDFKVPTCMVDRPRTADGATSFHFSYMSISKEAVPTLKGKPLEGVFGCTKQPALDHAKYIERNGAAEVFEGAQHAGYIERFDAIEAVDPSALVREAIERQLVAVYSETPTEEEASLLGMEAVAPDGVPSVFSNISDDPFERQEYWRAIERTEREPKSHRLFFDPEVSPRWWAAVEASEGLDPAFKEHLLNIAKQYRQYVETPTSNDEPKDPFKCAAYPPPGSKDRLTAERAGKLIEQAIGLPGFDYSQPPVEFKSGRGGRVQIRMVAELPHEISAEDRALIVQNFCDRLGALETRIGPDSTERQVGMMYTAVIHAPDAHNDIRNYHLHIVAHDRPASYLEEHGQWDFEYGEHYEHKSEHRVRYPLRQHKIGQIARAGAGADYSRAGRNFVPAMRRDFAKITNTVLKARGIKRQYDPRRYTEMGIDRTPTEHLGTKAAALEAIGVPTLVGQLNAIAIWNDAERNIEREAKQSDREYVTAQKRIENIVRETAGKGSSNPALLELRKLLVERERLTKSLAEDRRVIMAFDNMEAKAKSRAVRTRQTCLAYLGEIEKGVADGTTRVMKFSIEARFKAAQEHINSIDAALAPHRDTLVEAALDVERREARVLEIDRLIDPITSDLRDQLAIDAQKKSREAVQPAEAPAPLVTPSAPQSEPANARKKKRKQGEASRAVEQESDNVEPIKATDTPAPANDQDSNIERDTAPANAGPMTMEGLPIIEGTFQPQKREEQKKPSQEGPAPTPEGLEPLRPEVSEPQKVIEPEVFIPNLDKADQPEDAQPSSAKREPSPTQAEQDDVTSTKPPPTPAVEPETEVDKRKNEEDPTLFEPPKQEAPVNPGTKKAEHADWDALMDRIVKERIPIKLGTTQNGKPKYTVPALNVEDQATLKIRRFAYRTTARLESIYDHQQQEIKRLVRWVQIHGQDPGKLVLENRTAKLGDVKPAIKTLIRNWWHHPDILTAVRSEDARRKQLAKSAAKNVEPKAPPKITQPTIDQDIDLRRQEAVKKYPEPDRIYTKAVADFARLLREVAPEDKLRDAADKIWAGPKARDDVHRYGSALAIAYEKYVEGVQQREAIRHRGGMGGRG